MEGVLTDDWRDADLLRVQELFHGLIRSRCREGGIDVPADLPVLRHRESAMSNPGWFPIDGMYGGFSYWFEGDSDAGALICESWCRIVEGSLMRHRVTVTEVILLDSGPVMPVFQIIENPPTVGGP